MTQLDIHEAGERLADLIAKARAGEEVVISEHGKAVAFLISAEDPDRRAALGMFRGQIWMSPDFNDPLTEEELAEWGL
jgi:prevent-host-death family protein